MTSKFPQITALGILEQEMPAPNPTLNQYLTNELTPEGLALLTQLSEQNEITIDQFAASVCLDIEDENDPRGQIVDMGYMQATLLALIAAKYQDTQLTLKDFKDIKSAISQLIDVYEIDFGQDDYAQAMTSAADHTRMLLETAKLSDGQFNSEIFDKNLKDDELLVTTPNQALKDELYEIIAEYEKILESQEGESKTVEKFAGFLNWFMENAANLEPPSFNPDDKDNEKDN